MANDNSPADDAGSERVGERVRIFQRGQIWYANFQCNRRQYRESLGTANKKEARRRAAQIDVKLIAGEWKPAVETATVQEAVTGYLDMLETEGRSPKTLTKYRGVLNRVVALAVDRRITDLAGLDLKFLDAYRKQRTLDEAAEKTKYTELVIIRQLVLFALSRNLLAHDPQRGLKLKKPKATKQPFWTRAEVEQIVNASPTDVRSAFTLLAETGMRFGELAWLTWTDIDWNANLLRVQPKAGWKPKTGDQRTVPLSELARTPIHALPRISPWVVTMPPSKKYPAHGRQWTERRLLSALKRVLKPLKLFGKLHTFRHSFISHALLTGIPSAVVRSWVGHIDTQTIDLYTHIHDPASQAAMQRLSEANRSDASKENPQ